MHNKILFIFFGYEENHELNLNYKQNRKLWKNWIECFNLVISYLLPFVHFDFIISSIAEVCYRVHRKFLCNWDFQRVQGGIQKLREPKFTQFWPPTPIEWTIIDILQHNTYFLFMWTFYWPLTYPPLLVHVGNEWPLMT